MDHIGQAITWSTSTAVHLFTGVCTAYNYDLADQEYLDEDEAGDHQALVLHSQKAALDFEAKVTSDSTDFLDLSTGAALTVSTLNTGTIVALEAVETWRLGQPKMASVRATHYPDMVSTSPTGAGVALNAFTPAQSGEGGLTIVTPGGKIVWGTFGLGHASGVVHGLTLTQQLQFQEDEPSPAGTILGGAPHAYVRRISLEVLAKSTPPALGSTLTLTGAPSHAGGYKVQRVRTGFAVKRGKMYSISALWIPPFSS